MTKTMFIALLFLAAAAHGQDKEDWFQPLPSREAAPQESRMFRALGNALHMANAADLITTEYALHRGGAHEANPLMRNRAVRVTTKVIAPFAINHVTSRIYETHPKAAIIMRMATTAFFTYLASRNLEITFSVPVGSSR